jgi:response regulator NasT
VIHAAVEAGVSSYIVDGLSQERLRPILEVAIKRFQSEQALRRQLNETQEKLSERKWIERAKGLLMKQKHLSEEEAYQTLRKTAMDKNMRIIDVAKQLVTASKLII